MTRIDREKQTVRDLMASLREWLSDVDEMVMVVGSDRWLDIPVQDFQRMGAFEDPVAMVVAWDEIAALPECDTRKESH